MRFDHLNMSLWTNGFSKLRKLKNDSQSGMTLFIIALEL